jgi:hypothetical protein
MKTNTTKLAAELRRYNSWRRRDETIDQPEPMILGKIIDNAADRLEELERDVAAERAQIEANHKATRIIEEMLYAERALADRLAAELESWGDIAGGSAPSTIDEAVAAWKEARNE